NIDVKKFFQLVKMGFSSKRKKLKNNLKPIIKKEIDFDLNLRAEDLSVNDWIKLFNILDF
ncbi:16S rRNA (adenine(1518)-N(6)/adenine(1519)-N(6))-dimethyltransferase, partial [Patescibacteria group bacterium]|nr:16S rRNA (adenine(1518)-N(6)/adenine(1519)-N(6))-dimethyltransferase [Patescibacteria group bacterium]